MLFLCALGVINEMADYLHPLRSNDSLHKEFILLLKQPGRNLAKLSDEVSTVCSTSITLRSKEEEGIGIRIRCNCK